MTEYKIVFDGMTDMELVLLAHACAGSDDESDIAFRGMVLVELGKRDKTNHVCEE